MSTQSLYLKFGVLFLICLVAMTQACDTASTTPNVEATTQAEQTREALQETRIAQAIKQTVDAQPTPEPTSSVLAPTALPVPSTPTRVPAMPTREPPVSTVVLPPFQPIVHIVGSDESLYGIAVRYGTTVEAIVRVNGLPYPHRIYAGQRLAIPVAAPPPLPARILPPLPTRVPPTPTPVVPRPPQPPRPPQATVYVVRPGDTLYGIARRYGVSMWALARANNIANPNRIYAGQRLWIP